LPELKLSGQTAKTKKHKNKAMTSELTNALNRILAWTEKNFPNTLQCLQPGLSKIEIDELAKDLPFQLPPEVYELYQWRNGTRQGDNDWDKGYLFKGWAFTPLEDMAVKYRNYRTNKEPIPLKLRIKFPFNCHII
jgi:cell wall assembly regulator SMI1